MADSLIFPIGFDLEKGVKDAQGQIDVVLRRLQKTVDGRPLSIRTDIDTSKFSVFEAALRGSVQHITDDAARLKAALDAALKTDNSANINRITEAMRNLEAVWKSLPNNQKFDANGKLTAKAQNLIRQFNELATASNTYGQTLTQIAGKIRRAAEEEVKANQKRNDSYAKLRKTLGAQENSIANLTAKIKAYQQILNSKEIGSKSFERVAEKIRKLTEKLDAARAKVKSLTQTTVDNSKRQVDAHKNVTTALGEQNSYLGKLIKRMVVYSSFSQFRSFMSNIKEVTAQFELQRVSLGAIIQDQNKANQLFSEIKTFALKSPISIMDLTKYTKQVAAYRIETDKLFDTTKRLADVSVGLGVDMGRLVLAFGQVKAASFLRSAEIRQFTEAGIPMLELLAEKFSELQGRAVSTEQVMKMVENRMVDFRMVEQIFTDLTSAGGMFYNMQEKQGNTLFGLWAKLGDAASVMYDEIGNTDEATYVMKGAIQLLTDLMHNWRFVGREALVVGATLMVLHTRMKLVSSNTKMAETATNSYTLAQRRLNAAQAGSMTAKAAEAAKRAAVANRAAAMSTNAWTAAKFRLVAAVNQLKAALLGNWVTLAIAAFAAIGMAIYSAYEKAHRLDNELNKIRSEGSVIQDQSVENFNRLAKAAVESANGSKQQRDALEELNRTYKDILPTDALKLENLRKLKGNYESLTQSVREYIAMQQKEKAINTIQEEYGGDIEKIRKTLHSRFTDKLGPWKMSEEQFSAFWAEFVKQSGDATKKFEQRLRAAFETTGKDAEEMMDKVALHTPTSNPFGENYLEKANRLLDEQRVKIEAESKAWDKATGGLGKFYDKLEQAEKELSETRFISRGKNGEEVGVDKDTFLYQQMQANAAMKKAAQLIREDDTLKQAIQDKQVQLQPEWIHLVDSVNPNDLMNITYVNFDAIIKAVGDKYPDLTKRLEAIKKKWGNVVPNDGIVRLCQDRLSQIANGVKGGMDVMGKYLWNGSGTVDDYLKTLNNQITTMEAELYSAQQAVARYGVVGAAINFLNGRNLADVEAELEGLKKYTAFVQTLVKTDDKNNKQSRKGGTKSDPRLQILNEMVQLAEKLNKEYSDWEKKVGSTHALEKVNNTYKETVKYAEQVAKDAGIKLPHLKTPTNAKELNQYLDAVRKVMEAAKGLKGGKKAAIELAVKMSDNVSAEDQKAIEAKIKALSDRISRTKTAREFYEKILDMTGDIQLSANLAVSVYGQNGQDLQDAIREQIKTAFETDPEKNITIDLSEAIDPDTGAINYNKLAELEEKYKDVLISGRADLRQKLIDEGRKTSAAQVQQWLKDIEKAKDFAQQRIDLATYTANQIAAINARTDLPQADKDKLTKGYQDREAKQLAKLQYDEFKDSAMYVHIFEDLDHASTTALKNMRDRLIALKGQWLHLDPTQVKELTKAIADLDEQIAGRSPFKSILDGFKGLASARPQKVIDAELLTATEELTRREEALTTATKKYTEAQTAQLNAQAEVAQARQDLEDALAVSGGEETAEVKAAREVLGIKIATFNAIKAASADSISAAKTEVDKASEKYEEQKKVIDKLVEEGKIREANIKKIELANQKIDEYQQQINEALDGVRKMMEAFGASDEDMQFFDDVVGSINEIVDAGQQAAASVGNIMSGNPFQIFQGVTQGIGAIGGLVSGFTNLFYAGRVKRANKEIKRQQELLDQLEYTYGRLNDAADKLFGVDYLQNYNQQIKVLQAQQAAYLKQAQAERSKGKKEDKEKTKEFENQARETADKIKELQDDLFAHFTGQSRQDIARQLANSWIDARASMSDTFAAIKGDYKDLIKNMHVETMAAKIIENAFSQVLDDVDERLENNDVDGAVNAFINGMDTALTNANDGMEVWWKAMEARGYNMKEMFSDMDKGYTGIAKDVAGATSEEINANTAALNTQNYYMATLNANVALIRQLMERGTTSTLPDTTAAGWTDWERQAMDNYKAIAANTAATVVECKRAANACEAATEKLNRALRTKGATSGFNVFLNS